MSLLVAGTGSDVGKSAVVAGLCRWLRRRGVKVAPFKAQNMALNSAVTADGAEIGRAQAVQAAAAGVAPEATMNPILLKPTGDRTSQIVVMGAPIGVADAVAYTRRKPELLGVVLDALADLRARFDVVICEGAGSPAEINLRASDIVNMGLARAAGLPVVVVGDIDRGGVFAALYGTLALLEPGDQALIRGWVVNKFRGDPALLAPGLDRLQELTGRPVLGVLPWRDDLELDAEDSLALRAPPASAGGALDVAVVRLRRISNFTDLDALACEPDVRVRFTTHPIDVDRADLVVLPGTKATVEDLALIRASGVADALAARARRGDPILGVCGGYQMLGRTLHDDVESGAGAVAGLGLLPVDTVFVAGKLLTRPEGTCPMLGDVPVSGYEIRHGRVTRFGGEAFLSRDEGCVDGAVIGTSWHGLLENDALRRALLAWAAARRGVDFQPGTESFATLREARLDALGDLIEDHLDHDALEALLRR
jgi:adenosylcobyric acid synthase